MNENTAQWRIILCDVIYFGEKKFTVDVVN